MFTKCSEIQNIASVIIKEGLWKFSSLYTFLFLNDKHFHTRFCFKFSVCSLLLLNVRIGVRANDIKNIANY